MDEMAKLSMDMNFEGGCIRVNSVLCNPEREVEDEGEAAGERDVPVSESPSLSDKHRQDDIQAECMFLMQDIIFENMELKDEMYKLKKEVKTLKNQLSQSLTQEDLQIALDIDRQKIIEELKDSFTFTGHIHTSTNFSLTQTCEAECHKAPPKLDTPKRLEDFSDCLKALRHISEMLYGMNKHLESRITLLEGVQEGLEDKVSQLEAQLKSKKKADLQAPEIKVVKEDSTTSGLHGRCEDPSKQFNMDCQRFAKKVANEPDAKLNHGELDSLQKQLKTEPHQNDNNARPNRLTVVLHPKPSGSIQQSDLYSRLDSLKDYSSSRFKKNLCKGSTDMKNTKTGRLPIINSNEGNIKNKHVVNHKWSTFPQNKRLLPLRPQISKTMIATGSRTVRNNTLASRKS